MTPDAKGQPLMARKFALAYPSDPKHTPTKRPSAYVSFSSKTNGLKVLHQIPEVTSFRDKWPVKTKN